MISFLTENMPFKIHSVNSFIDSLNLSFKKIRVNFKAKIHHVLMKIILLKIVECRRQQNEKFYVYDCPSESYLCDKDAITVDNLN